MSDLLMKQLLKSVEMTAGRTYLCVGCGKEWNGLELVPLKLSQINPMEYPPPDGGCPKCGSKCFRNVLGEVGP